jgi:hypothetical protein
MAEKPFKVNSFSNAAGGGSEATSVQHLLVSNSSTTIDSTALSTLSSIEYVIEIEQGTKRRVSNVSLRTDGTNVSITEYGVVEIGGALSGFALATSTSSGNALLNITITDAATTNAFIDMDKLIKNKVLSPYGIATTTATNVGTSRAYNNGAASVAFTAASFGESPTAYTVTSVADPTKTASGSSSPIVVAGLASESTHSFSVTPSNANGIGPSRTSDSITATTVPQAPTIGAATKLSDTSGSIAFTAGATGGSSITGFTATSTPGSLTQTGASSPLTFTGLADGNYTFTVFATNANGNSAASAASIGLFIGPEPGASWTTRSVGDNGDFHQGRTAFGSGKYIINSSFGTFRQSTNGVSWAYSPPGTDIIKLSYGNGTFVAMSYNNYVQTSTDGGGSWTSRAVPAKGFQNFSFSGHTLGTDRAGNWMSYSGDGSNAHAYRISSDNAVTWTTPSLTGLSGRLSWGGITFGNGLWIAGTYAGAILSSTDRLTWTTRTTTGARPFVSYANGRFFATASGSKMSTDGITWTTTATDLGGDHTVVYNAPVYLAQNFFGVKKSTDGSTWTTALAQNGYQFIVNNASDATLSNASTVIITANGGVVRTSP